MTTAVYTPVRKYEHRVPTVEEVYAAHSDFVWLTLQRLGVAESDLPDVMQEVFVVVHQRLSTFEGNSALTTWLFGVCLRVVGNYRRRAHRRREQVTDDVGEVTASTAEHDPEESASRAQARARLRAVLDEMDLEKRAVFVMFEIEEKSSEEIASMLAVPVGTVYSRLHAARAQFRSIVARKRARDGWRGGR